MEDETPRLQLDNGTPVFALGELRRHLGTSWDPIVAALIGAIDRSGSAIIQADTAKTVQEEVRHLVRALAAAGEVYFLAAEHARGTIDGIRRETGLPIEPSAPELLQAVDRSCGVVLQSDNGSTAQDEIRNLVRALATAAQVYALTAALARATLDERRLARWEKAPASRR